MHIILMLDGVVPEVKVKMKSFTATFFKLRYETLFNVFRQLLWRRDILRQVDRRMFPNAQDPQALDDFLAACRWELLWSFVDASYTAAIKNIREEQTMGPHLFVLSSSL